MSPDGAVWGLGTDGRAYAYCPTPETQGDGVNAPVPPPTPPQSDTGRTSAVAGSSTSTETSGVASGLLEATGSGSPFLGSRAAGSGLARKARAPEMAPAGRARASDWLPVPLSLSLGQMMNVPLTSIALTRTCAWVTTAKGHVFVRWSVTRASTIGERWERVPAEQFVVRVKTCAGEVWAVLRGGILAVRCCFSQVPHETMQFVCKERGK